MKKRIQKLTLLLAFLSLSLMSFSQSAGSVQLKNYSLDSTKNEVRVSIKTSESFIVGANRYVLHIGGKHFFRNIHPDGQLNEIVFLLSVDEYENLQAQGRIVLVYGFYHENTQQDGEGAQANGFTGKHWDLGKFNPEILNSK